MPARVTIMLENRTVNIRAWKYEVKGIGGFTVPVYFLDTDLDENAEEDRQITHFLYGGNEPYRLKQEAVLGIGGVKILHALGYKNIFRYHMNEGHAGLLTFELLLEEASSAGREYVIHDDVDAVRGKCVFTTHNDVDSITNGVHVPTWTSAPFQKLYDTYIPGWRGDNLSLRYALKIPRNEIWNAHNEAKKELLDYVNEKTNAGMVQDIFTVGFARRATPYKRAALLFSDVERIKRMVKQAGRMQIIYAGKAHPRDEGGKELIREIFRMKELLKDDMKIVYLENYDIELGKLLTSGVDLWLNTPPPPLEASGTSGMKAALNGVPSLSVLDGWWFEGHIEGITGWSIGSEQQDETADDDGRRDAEYLYDKLEFIILPLYYRNRDRYIDVMLNAIALNGSFFNTKRMVLQYLLKAYHKGMVQF